jgi:hypothetical protein
MREVFLVSSLFLRSQFPLPLREKKVANNDNNSKKSIDANIIQNQLDTTTISLG